MKYHYFHLPVIILVFLFAIVSSNEPDSTEGFLLNKLKLLEKENTFLKNELKKNQNDLSEIGEKLIDISADVNKTAFPYFPNTTCFDNEALEKIIENLAQIGNNIHTANPFKNEVSEIADFSSTKSNLPGLFSHFASLEISDVSDSQPDGRNKVDVRQRSLS